MMRFVFVFFSLLVVGGGAEQNKYNVLIIAVDDLRPELGCYGAKHVFSPNIDQLAAEGRMFTHHYVAVATCGASRYAMLTGRRPSVSGAMGNGALYSGKTALKHELLAGAQSLPELFKRSGYRTSCIGKISHQPDGKVFAYNASGDGRVEVPNAWDELPTPYGVWKRGWGIFFAYGNGRHREDKSGYRPVMEFPDCGDSELPDGQLADTAIDALKRMKDERFFLSVGFFKPHLPFVAPKKYWDMYEGQEIPLAPNGAKGSKHWHGSGEFFGYQFPFEKKKPLADENARKARQAYFACVSYTDAQVGRVLAELKRVELDKNTIVVLWGDHGWHLGDNQMWGKHSPLEYANRSPLILRVPGMKQAGTPTAAVVETVDIFPTLAELCDTKFKKTEKPLSGVSLASILNQPEHPGKTAAISYWRQARSVRTQQYRLIVDKRKPLELYDHKTDPHEAKNLAQEKPEVVERLRKLADVEPVLVEF